MQNELIGLINTKQKQDFQIRHIFFQFYTFLLTTDCNVNLATKHREKSTEIAEQNKFNLQKKTNFTTK